MLYLAGTFGAIFMFRSAFCHRVCGCSPSCFLCLTYELICVCGCLHILDLKRKESVSSIITMPVFTELFSVKPTSLFWDFDSVPPEKTFYKYVHKLYFESCTTFVVFEDVCQTSTVCGSDFPL